MADKLVLIDGHSILNRAFYGLPDLTNSAGVHTNAVYGFLNILFKILDEEKPKYLTVAFDLSAPTFRHKMFAEYKGTRKAAAPEFKQQVPIMKDVLRAMGVVVIEKEGFEADDLLGTVSRIGEKEGLKVSIISGDRDLLQLATENVLIRIPKTKKTGTEIEDYYPEDVRNLYKVSPKEFIDVKALMGDSSDNISGVPGIGEKGATTIIEQFGSIENAYEHIEEIKQPKAREALRAHYDMAVLSKQLATIKLDCDIDYDIKKAEIGNLFTEEAYKLLRELELKKVIAHFEKNGASKEAAVEMAEDNYNIVCVQNESDLADVRKTFIDEVKAEDEISFVLVSDKAEVKAVLLTTSSNREEIVLLKADDANLSGEVVKKLTKEILSGNAKYLTIDLKEALKVIFPEGVKKEKRDNFEDLEIIEYLLNPLKSEYSYEDMASAYLGKLYSTKEELLGKSDLIKALTDEGLFENAKKYLANKCYAIKPLYDVMSKRLAEIDEEKLYREIEKPLIFVLADMETEGIICDGEALKAYGDKLKLRIDELEKSIYEKAGEEFNINSPKQLGVILFEKLNLPGGKKTKTGYSTAADVLEKLAPDNPIIKEILEYRQLTKLKSTYADGLIAFIGEDKRIHTTFKQNVTATGRISSIDPNLQNIPIRMELGRLIRKVFLPKEGYCFADADYSQIELRLLAHMSGDEKLIFAYKMAQDIHAITASQVFKIPLNEVTPLHRRNAKAVNFGIVYGISSFGLSEDLSISRQEAKEYIENYFVTFPGIKDYLDSCVTNAKEKGYSTTLYGRRRPIPELTSSNFMQRSFGERVAMNAPIQGTAADIIKIAMIRVHDRLIDEGLESRLILQVHDELIIETKNEEKEIVSKILTEEMKNAADLTVELETDMHFGSDWYEAK